MVFFGISRRSSMVKKHVIIGIIALAVVLGGYSKARTDAEQARPKSSR
jgi:hypothetical protein